MDLIGIPSSREGLLQKSVRGEGIDAIVPAATAAGIGSLRTWRRGKSRQLLMKLLLMLLLMLLLLLLLLRN